MLTKCGLSILAINVAVGIAAGPGESHGCWTEGYTYEVCCLQKSSCFEEAGGFTRTSCCSGLLQAFYSSPDLDKSAPPPPRKAWPGISDCVKESVRDDIAGDASLHKNSFLRIVQCLAELPVVDVVLDLFLGGGNSVQAAVTGLQTTHSRRGQLRSSEVFSFEQHEAVIQEVVGPTGLLGNPQLPAATILNVSEQEGELLEEQLLEFQTLLLNTTYQDHPAVWILNGKPYPRDSLKGYTWNALDILCQHRAPIDLVLIDVMGFIEAEWMIIELVCRPRLVVLFGTNVVGSASWISNRLELEGIWQREAQGHFLLHKEPWYALTELRRKRAWVIYSNLLERGSSE